MTLQHSQIQHHVILVNEVIVDNSYDFFIVHFTDFQLYPIAYVEKFDSFEFLLFGKII